MFYRQGHFVNTNVKDINVYQHDDMSDTVLDQMFLVYNKALVAQTSQEISFFKLKAKKWVLYKTLKIKGFVSYTKGDEGFQIISEDKIYFYGMNKENLQPELRNTMFNYIGCSQMIFDTTLNYCVTYNLNQEDFEIHRRKYQHDFKAKISGHNFEGCMAMELES